MSNTGWPEAIETVAFFAFCLGALWIFNRNSGGRS